MNIDLQLTAAISKVSIRTKEKDDIIRRICKVTFGREFDQTLAAALGADARTALKALEVNGLLEAKIPIDGIVAQAKLIAGSANVTIPILKGLSARAKAGLEDDPPSIRLDFEFDFHEPSWVFLGRYCNSYTELTLTTIQPSLLPKDNLRADKPRAGA